MCSTMLTQRIAKPPFFIPQHWLKLLQPELKWSCELQHTNKLSKSGEQISFWCLWILPTIATISQRIQSALCSLVVAWNTYKFMAKIKQTKKQKTLFVAGIKCWLWDYLKVLRWTSPLFVRKSFQFFSIVAVYFGLLAIEIKVKHTAVEWVGLNFKALDWDTEQGEDVNERCSTINTFILHRKKFTLKWCFMPKAFHKRWNFQISN